jgi:hydrogenase expression/formation protein HypE
MTPALKFRDTHISLAHGNGGRMMRNLIEQLFVPALANPRIDTGADAVSLPISDGHELVVTTDGFTVQPLEFPGGNIGSLAVHGTVNDLAVSGAVPRFMTLSVFLEEGLEIARLRRVVDELGKAARNCGVSVVAGDTKVVGRGECDGIYLAATGIGFRPRGITLGLDQVRAGDRILVSGPVGSRRGGHAGPPSIRPARRPRIGRCQRAAPGAGSYDRPAPAFHARSDARWARHRRS